MKRVFKAAILPLTIAGLILLGWWLVKDVRFDVLQPNGSIAESQRQLLTFTVLLSLVVIIPVFTLLGVFAVKYREGNKKADYQPEWKDNSKLEMLWWGIPIAIISLLAVITWQTSHSLDPYRPIQSDKQTIKVQVVALQWKWLFLYPDYGVASVNHLTVPEKTPIRFSLTADAPMSAFWVPTLGSQIYTMNGMSSQLNLIADRPGDFKGYATNINGRGYANMTFTVHAKPQAGFESWIANSQASSHKMNEDVYTELARPNVLKEEKTYYLADPNLYSTILNKYMGHMKHNTTELDRSNHDTSNHTNDVHSSHTMEGM